MPPYLPTELLQAILEGITSSGDFARCCSISKTFRSIAQPLLYHTIVFSIVEDHYEENGSFQFRYNMGRSRRSLFKTLLTNAHLRPLVQEVWILGSVGSQVHYGGGKNQGTSPEKLLEILLKLLPRVKLFTLDNISHRDGVDQVVRSSQIQQHDLVVPNHPVAAPKYSLVWPGSLVGYSPFVGAYERFQWIPFSMAGNHVNLNWLLASSQHTLRTLWIPLDNATSSLSSFHRLQRLSLQLSVKTPSNAVPDVIRAISSLPSLEMLILRGRALEEDLSVLLRSGTFARSLPSTLSLLSFDFKLNSEDVTTFLHDLPTAKGLRCLNYLGEMDENGAVRDECNKRGISLCLNEKWDI